MTQENVITSQETALIEQPKHLTDITNKFTDKPSIYVACLASYNAGKLHGQWIDCTIGYEYVQEAIRDMLKSSSEPYAEEWAIHDYEGFEGYKVSEWEDIIELCELAEVLDSENGELMVAIKDHLGSGTTLQEAKEFLENNYMGCHKDLGDYASSSCDDRGDLKGIPNYIRWHIDFDSMGRDWEYSGDIFTITMEDGMHVFLNN